MKGVLLANLGSTKSYDPEDVKEYLDEFLMDPNVIDFPYWLRSLLVRGIILKTRPRKTAENYKRIWLEEGSPMIVISERLKEKIAKQTDIPVGLCMRYGEPSIKTGMQQLVEQEVDDILVLPLFPHYAMSTIGTAVNKTLEVKKEHFSHVNLEVVPPFYNSKDYIEVIAKSILDAVGDVEFDHLLFSYHGVPERHIRKDDVTNGHCKIDGSCCKNLSEAHNFCYRHQCYETTRLVAEKLQLTPESYSVSFQSRLGIDPWLKPYTAKTIEKFAKDGVQKLAVVTPAFTADCIETIDEIDREGRELFIESGGREFTTIPCLNDRDDWVEVILSWITGWVETGELSLNKNHLNQSMQQSNRQYKQTSYKHSEFI